MRIYCYAARDPPVARNRVENQIEQIQQKFHN